MALYEKYDSAYGEPEAEFESSSKENTDRGLTDEDSQDTSNGFREISLERLNIALPRLNITPGKTGKHDKDV